jgi:hypothetical protein
VFTGFGREIIYYYNIDNLRRVIIHTRPERFSRTVAQNCLDVPFYLYEYSFSPRVVYISYYNNVRACQRLL